MCYFNTNAPVFLFSKLSVHTVCVCVRVVGTDLVQVGDTAHRPVWNTRPVKPLPVPRGHPASEICSVYPITNKPTRRAACWLLLLMTVSSIERRTAQNPLNSLQSVPFAFFMPFNSVFVKLWSTSAVYKFVWKHVWAFCQFQNYGNAFQIIYCHVCCGGAESEPDGVEASGRDRAGWSCAVHTVHSGHFSGSDSNAE